MSEYDSGPRRHGSRRTRPRDPEYVQETTYVERGSGAPVRDLVYRPREDSIEDIPRDFPPPSAEHRQARYRETYAPRRAHSVGRRDYEDDYPNYAYSRSGRGRSRGREDYGYYSDDYDRPRHHARRKSIVDQIKDVGEGLGLRSVIGAVAGKRSQSRSRDRHRHDRRDRRDRYSSSSQSRSRSRHGRGDKKWEQAAKAALVAGAVEAFRSRKEPGPWTGEKGQRIATAALGAAGIDSFVDKDPDRKGKRHIAESALGGLLANRLANGPRERSASRDGRGRSRSRSRSRSLFGRSQSRGRDGGGGSTIRDVAGAGAVLAAGKALYNRVRSKSRSRKNRSRSRSLSSEDNYAPSRGRNRNYNRPRSRHGGYGAGPVAAGAGLGAAAGSRRRDNSSSSTSTTDMENQRRKLRAQPYPNTYADANPYAAGIAPPPIGAPPGARYH